MITYWEQNKTFFPYYDVFNLNIFLSHKPDNHQVWTIEQMRKIVHLS